MSTQVISPSHHPRNTEKNEKGQSVPVSEENYDTNSSDNGDVEKSIPEYGSYPDHIFANDSVAEYWRTVYEKAHYEGRHQFDPNLTWTAEEEKRIRRKVCVQPQINDWQRILSAMVLVWAYF